MKIVRFEVSGEPRLGLVTQLDGAGSPVAAVDISGPLGQRSGRPVTDLGQLLAGGERLLDQVRGLAAEPGRGPEPVTLGPLLPPVGADSLIISLGRNFLSHAAEMAGGAENAKRNAEGMRGFIKSARTTIGSGADILLPASNPDRVDYEGELGVVIGRDCHAVTAAEAAGCIAGYLLLNDVSARDWIPEVRAAQGTDQVIMAWDHNILGKQFPTFGPLGPMFVSADEVPDFDALVLTTHVNGQLRQRAAMSELANGPAEMVAHFAYHYGFRPGDIVTTGTPAGVGIGRNPPEYLREGDVVSVAAGPLGQLRNRVSRAASRGA